MLLALRPTAHRVAVHTAVQLGHAGSQVTLRPNDRALQTMLSRLHRGELRVDLEDRLRTEFPDRWPELSADLDRLIAADVVRSIATTRAVTDRHSRTRTFLSQFADQDIDEDELLGRIRRSTITVVGVGGLGSWILHGLIGLGVARLRLADFDVVEESNLNRSSLFEPGDIGTPKIAAARRAVRRGNPDIDVDVVPIDLARGPLPATAVADADLVISTADKPPWQARREVATACVAADVPFLCPAGYRVGPFHLGPGTACVMCELDEMLDCRPGAAAAMEAMATIPASEPGSVPHIAASAASVALAEVLWHLSGVAQPNTVNRIWTADGSLAARYVDRPPYSGCSTCSRPARAYPPAL